MYLYPRSPSYVEVERDGRTVFADSRPDSGNIEEWAGEHSGDLRDGDVVKYSTISQFGGKFTKIVHNGRLIPLSSEQARLLEAGLPHTFDGSGELIFPL